MRHYLPPFRYLDLYLIWIVLLLFNFNIYGVYTINYIAIAAAVYLLFSIRFYRLNNLIYFLLILLITFLGFARSGGYAEPFKYVFCFFQIYIFYNYFLLRLITRKMMIGESTRILNFFKLSFSIYAVLTFYEFSSGGFLWFESRNYDSFLPRVNLGFGDPNSLASFLLIGMLLLPTRFALVNFVSIVAGLLTFSRAYILSYLFAMVLKSQYLHFKPSYLLFISSFILVFYFFPYEYLLNSLGVNLNIDFVLDRLLSSSEVENPRMIEWIISISAVEVLPDWSVFYNTLDPHNSLLLALNLFGIFGTAILIFNLIKSCWCIKKLIRDLPQAVNFDLVILAFIIFNSLNSELFSIRSTAALGIILGLLVGVSGRQACLRLNTR